MAAATVKTIKKFDGVTLELNKEEAATLKIVLQLIGGDNQLSLRKYTNEILFSLAEVPNLLNNTLTSTSGHITFGERSIQCLKLM